MPSRKHNVPGMAAFNMRSKPRNEFADEHIVVIVAIGAVHEVGRIKMDAKLFPVNGSKQLFVAVGGIRI